MSTAVRPRLVAGVLEAVLPRRLLGTFLRNVFAGKYHEQAAAIERWNYKACQTPAQLRRVPISVGNGVRRHS